jgi:hypothetical protein
VRFLSVELRGSRPPARARGRYNGGGRAFTESAANPRRRLSAAAELLAWLNEFRLARAGRAPNGAGHVPAGEREPRELVVWHEFLDQRKELSLLKPDVCVKQRPRRSQRLSIDDAGRHGDFEFASEPLELQVVDACLAEGAGCDWTYRRNSGKSSSSSPRRWTRSSFRKNSTNSLAAASRAKASPPAAAGRSRSACTSPS